MTMLFRGWSRVLGCFVSSGCFEVNKDATRVLACAWGILCERFTGLQYASTIMWAELFCSQRFSFLVMSLCGCYYRKQYDRMFCMQNFKPIVNSLYYEIIHSGINEKVCSLIIRGVSNFIVLGGNTTKLFFNFKSWVQWAKYTISRGGMHFPVLSIPR